MGPIFVRFRLGFTGLWKSIRTAAIASAITTALLMVLSSLSLFDTYELKSLDLFQRFNAPISDSGIAMVEIDQRGLTVLSEQGIQWPWPRQIYAPLIEICAEAGAKGIMFDIMFSEPSSYGRDDDLEFARSVESAGNVFFPIAMSSGEQYQTDIAPIERFGVRDIASQLRFKESRSYVPPIEELRARANGLGDVLISPDRDGIYRRVSLFTRYRSHLIPCLAAAPLKNRFVFRENLIFLDGRPLAVSEKGEFILYYYGRDFKFERLNVLELIAAYQNPGTPGFHEVVHRIRDRFIIIALTAPGLRDLCPTAVSSLSPGAFVHGTLLVNLLHGDHVRGVGGIWKSALVLLLGITLGFLIVRTQSFWRNGLAVLVFVLGWPIVSFGFLHFHRYWIGFLPYELAFVVVFGLTATYGYSTEGKRRRMIRHIFSRYMSDVLVKELESDPEKAKLGGERRFITIFFSDLADFTLLCETFEAEKIVNLLNDSFTEMSQIILDTKGIIDKYQGDGIMAFWGAPTSLKEHAVMACLAAIKCQRRMEDINQRLSREGFPPLVMRIGLHSGEAIVGNMGSTHRFDFTAVGDNVNVASRLEGLNKLFGTRIIVSEMTYELAKERVVARELDLIAVKGKTKAIRILELLGERSEMTQEEEQTKALFEEGLRRYRMRAFDEAQRAFESVAASRPHDQPCRIFIARCNDFRNAPPPLDWDGVTRLI